MNKGPATVKHRENTVRTVNKLKTTRFMGKAEALNQRASMKSKIAGFNVSFFLQYRIQ